MLSYNILCVTKRTDLDGHGGGVGNSQFHLPISGTAEVTTVTETRLGVPIVKTVVIFESTDESFGKVTGDILWVGTGLDGNAVVITMKVSDQQYPSLELYTDVPAPSSSKTPQDLRELAAEAIKRGERTRPVYA